MKRSSIAPPNDDELAAAEVIDLQKRRDRIQQVEDEQETARLARAGDPEALAALGALNSVLKSQPMGEEEPTDVQVERDPKPAQTGAKARSTRPANARKGARTAPPPRDDDAALEARAKITEARAFKLMDMAYQKWHKGAKQNQGRANKELALDLGRDTVLYLRHGLIKSLGDMHDVITKLTAVKAGAEDPEAPAFDEEMESMRAALRGEAADGD